MGHAIATIDEITLRRKAAAAKAVATRRANCAECRTTQKPDLRQIELPNQIKAAIGAQNCRCETCGLPDGANSTHGYFVQIVRKAENAFKRDSKATVWVCSRECGVQALAVSAYGALTSRWPVSLDQFRATVSSVFAQRAQAH
jgi:hypothetical protein